MKISFIIFSVSVILFGCYNGTNKSSSAETNQVLAEKTVENPAKYLGNYHGIQATYFMKNQYGYDMIIGGKKVSVPSSDFKFLIKENGIVSLQQTNLEDNSRYYYDGTFVVKNENENSLEIECKLSDGKSSNPTYNIAINKPHATAGVCKGNKEPEFKLEKIK